MEHCQRPTYKTDFDEKVVRTLKDLFLAKGYPEDSLRSFVPFAFIYNEKTFELILPLIVELNCKCVMICYFKPSLSGLLSFEREALALARIFSSPPPRYALLTNLKSFVFIDVKSGKGNVGGAENIPDYQPDLLERLDYVNFILNLDVEKRLLYLYLSGG